MHHLVISLCATRKIHSFTLPDSHISSALSDIFVELNGLTISDVTTTIGTILNASEIHQWFIDNVQGGSDNCGTYRVDRCLLNDLRNKCKSIIEVCDYTTSYFQQFHDMIALIDIALTFPDNWEIEYCGDWR